MRAADGAWLWTYVMGVSGITEPKRLTLVGELIKATEELEDKAEEARAKRRQEAAKRREEAAQVDESTLQRAAEETPPENDTGASNVEPTTPGQTGTIIDVSA